jgi:hypothetical protein
MRELGIAVIQEPWVYQDRIRRLHNTSRTLCSAGPGIAPRSCMTVRNTVCALPLSALCFWGVTSPTLSKGLREVVDYGGGNKSQLIFACNAKTQHTMWGDWLMEHVVSTTVTGDRKEVADLALGLVMTDWHTVGLLPGGDLVVSRPIYRNKGNQSGRPEGGSRG